jgi:hypothetical protein
MDALSGVMKNASYMITMTTNVIAELSDERIDNSDVK